MVEKKYVLTYCLQYIFTRLFYKGIYCWARAENHTIEKKSRLGRPWVKAEQRERSLDLKYRLCTIYYHWTCPNSCHLTSLSFEKFPLAYSKIVNRHYNISQNTERLARLKYQEAVKWSRALQIKLPFSDQAPRTNRFFQF